MDEIGDLRTIREADVERSTEDIRQDIAKGKENISQTVEHIEERIKEKLDWRGYVKDYPYLALGAAAGLGCLASEMFRKRTTPLERFLGSIAEEVHDSLGGLRAGAAGPGLIKLTLLGIATKAITSLIKNVTSTVVASRGTVPRPQTGRDSIVGQRADT